jgi:hypothetical protein
MTKKIEAPLIETTDAAESWSHLMDKLTRHHIDNAPWPAFVDKSDASFSIGHITDAILIKFYVNDRQPRITYHAPNDPVYKDSCVEFFISFDEGASYYNMEFNAVGTCLMAHGQSRNDRTPVPASLIQTISHASSLQSSPNAYDQRVGWSLTLNIPLNVFVHNKISSLSGLSAKANFYKCGDDCPKPHYLAWNNILTPGPDFHQPGFFGDLHFL